MKRKVVKKLALNKETVRTLHDMSLKEAQGGGPPSEGTGCTSCFDTCRYIYSGVCC